MVAARGVRRVGGLRVRLAAARRLEGGNRDKVPLESADGKRGSTPNSMNSLRVHKSLLPRRRGFTLSEMIGVLATIETLPVVPACAVVSGWGVTPP
jgi:hypothetical protein